VFLGSSPAFVQPFNANLEQSFRPFDGRFSSFDRHRGGGSVLLLVPQQRTFAIEPLETRRQFLVQPFNPNFEQSFRPFDGRFSSFDRHRGGSVLLVPQQRSFIEPFVMRRQFLVQPFGAFNSIVVITPNHFVSEPSIVSPPRTLQFARVFNRRLGSSFLVVLPPCKPARVAVLE
jgi:hypothetical protein